MQYKAWISRTLSHADETIQIVIEDTDDITTLQKRVLEAFGVTDYRAHEQYLRLFEDTDLTQELNYDELSHARKFAGLLFPLESLPRKLDLGNKTAFEFAKNLPGGEVLKLYIHEFDTYEDIVTAIKTVWRIIDSRLAYTNNRELRASTYFREKIPLGIKSKIHRVMDILYGRAFKENVVQDLRAAKVEETVRELRDEVQKGIRADT